MDALQRFPLVWCPTCEKTQKMIFDVLPAGGKNDHDAADIVCYYCKSIIATMHAPPGTAGQCASQAGREGARDGGPSIGPSDRPIGERRRTENPHAKAS
jgi:hypothetical protein